MYALINTMEQTADVRGRVLSMHRTEEAAIAANYKLQRSFRRSEWNGSTSYLLTAVVEVDRTHRKGDYVNR